ncbi:MAG: undecaprenyl/decaprenyl-phosphate alpha-N-acetylglucosaminyl 1-phosphate transferase [Bacteroidia bacterium]|nr:undecaprenyl/decaprenyl-phosphate alpha-N-acetylglucosaminyl 1-phosphate transferase [Bacteroidia bacterium]MCC6768925.1 undecaprenyl/decaprenyl-phosphate alpha-N-acetylglucosaminyl 1-phosphate transferase [Bacteroidia bacterium]
MLFLSIGINGLLLKFSVNLGAKNEQSQVRWASTTKPAFGGVSFYIIFLISVVFFTIFFGNDELLLNAKFLGLFIASSLGFLMGLADDAYNTKPLLKFSVQLLCALIFIFSGNMIQAFPWEWMNIAVTILWVTGMMNSVNMLDNMDGITASFSMVACVAVIMMLVITEQFSSLSLVVLVGVLSGIGGFLYYNWNPSRMYMGDSGSQFLGAFLAGVAIQFMWNGTDYYGQIIQAKQILIPALIFIVPISDTTTVFINRLRKGQSPFVGGRDHTTHHLHYMGLSDRHVAIVMVAISLSTMAVCVFVINNIRVWGNQHTFLFSALALAILLALYSTTRFGKPKPKAPTKNS